METTQGPTYLIHKERSLKKFGVVTEVSKLPQYVQLVILSQSKFVPLLLFTTWKCVPQVDLLTVCYGWPATYTRYFALGMHLPPTLQSLFSFHLGCSYARNYSTSGKKKKLVQYGNVEKSHKSACVCSERKLWSQICLGLVVHFVSSVLVISK